MKLAEGNGFTVNEKIVAGPVQPLRLAWMENTFVCAVSLALSVVNAGIFPVPLFVLKPLETDGVVFVQLIFAAGTAGVADRPIAGLSTEGQYSTLLCEITGVGFTVMFTVAGEPVQPLRSGNRLIVPVMLELVVLEADVKAGGMPFPFAAKPTSVLLLFQVKVTPDDGFTV